LIARRLGLAVILALGLLGVSPVADGQPSTKVPRIGWLTVTSPDAGFAHLLEAFSQGLRDLGYVEGRTIAVDYRWAEGKPERLPALAAELLALKVDVIVTPNPPSALAAKQATSSVPIVMLGSIDPVKSGLVASLARPGGNITGLSATAGPEIVGKYLELLREVIPALSRVAVLRNPNNPDHPEMWNQVDRAARALGVQPQVLEARNPGELDAAFAVMSSGRAEALVVLGDVTFFRHAARIADLAGRSRLPTISSNRELAAGGFS
jgi:putative ABC transport system substrate-binding protein